MKKSVTKQFVFTIMMVFFLLLFMLFFIFSSFYRSSVKDINEIGVSHIKSKAAMVENYLLKSIDILGVTADTVDYMLKNNTDTEEILNYLTEETKYETERVDENFTGVYGYISGEYLDGAGWVPDADYEPTERVWYQIAKEADGKVAIVPPYLDAQTNTIMLSVSQMLSDGKSVVSLDIALNKVQAIAKNMKMKDIGYGFIMDDTGLVIAHLDEKEKGKVYPNSEEQKQMISKIFENKQDYFTIMIGGEKCTVFSNKVMSNWYVVMVVSDDELFYDLRIQIIAGILVSVVVFMIIVVFCTFSVKKIKQYQDNEIKSHEQMERMNKNIIRALAYTIDAKDRYTIGHSQRVADYSLAIAKRMGKSEKEQETIYYSALLHDVGKIRVPEEIINKPGKLTDEEFEQIQIHTVSGYHILKDIHENVQIAYGAKYHHERYNGKGYPNGLEGKNIPEIARIIGVADAYDAMASNRSYRGALPQDVVREEIEKGRGEQFDPEIADIMLQMIDEDSDYSMCQSDVSQKKIMVVDDELMNIKMVEYIFKDSSGFQIIGVQTLEETFAILEEQDIDLILLDLRMPDVDGFELYQMIKQKYDIRVVLMTSDKSMETIQRISELKIDDYLTKPLHPFVVKEIVHSVVNSWDR